MFSTRYLKRNNICGINLARIRNGKRPYISQAKMAERLQLAGFDADRHVIRRIENGKRFVTDIELKIMADVLGISIEALLTVPKED